MLDRESTFANPHIVTLLKTKYVPVAIDQHYQRRQKDTEGDFYRKIAGQGPRNNFNSTTQGFYIVTASGKLLLFNNNRDPKKVQRLMTEKLAEFQQSDAAKRVAEVIPRRRVDTRWNVAPPDGGLVIRVNSKVLGGYEPTTDPFQSIFQTAISRDNLWISASEHTALTKGQVTAALQQRISRFHLVDNTRGEPPMWRENEVKQVTMQINNGKLTGTVHLETQDGKRGYRAELLGRVESTGGKIVRFDVVALGDFWGEGTYTRRAPKGKFPLGITFRIADGTDVADRIQPQASRGWVDGYIRK